MGFIIKFILFTAIFFFLFRLISSFLFGKRNPSNTYRHRPQQQQPSEPETQEDRILEYQKKSFEKTDAVDVEFEEIKQKDSL